MLLSIHVLWQQLGFDWVQERRNQFCLGLHHRKNWEGGGVYRGLGQPANAQMTAAHLAEVAGGYPLRDTTLDPGGLESHTDSYADAPIMLPHRPPVDMADEEAG